MFLRWRMPLRKNDFDFKLREVIGLRVYLDWAFEAKDRQGLANVNVAVQ